MKDGFYLKVSWCLFDPVAINLDSFLTVVQVGAHNASHYLLLRFPNTNGKIKWGEQVKLVSISI